MCQCHCVSACRGQYFRRIFLNQFRHGRVELEDSVLGCGSLVVVNSVDHVDQAAHTSESVLFSPRDSSSHPSAVRRASLTRLCDRRARYLSTHPFYWAAFIAAGDWR